MMHIRSGISDVTDEYAWYVDNSSKLTAFPVAVLAD